MSTQSSAFVDEHPEAKSAMDELCRQMRHPFDPTEQDLGNGLGSESD